METETTKTYLKEKEGHGSVFVLSEAHGYRRRGGGHSQFEGEIL
jgi:hypothetical protein